VKGSALSSESYQLKARAERTLTGSHLISFVAELPSQAQGVFTEGTKVANVLITAL
jgi:hypothetical protein